MAGNYALIWFLAACTDSVIGQMVRLIIMLSGNMSDAEVERSSQLAAGPVQGIQAGAAAGVLAGHLFYYQLGVGINAQRGRIQLNREVQGLEQRRIFGNVVILMANPFGDADGPTFAAIDHHPNARRPWIAQGTTVHISHES